MANEHLHLRRNGFYGGDAFRYKFAIEPKGDESEEIFLVNEPHSRAFADVLVFALLLLASAASDTVTEFTARFTYSDPTISGTLSGSIQWSSVQQRQRLDYDQGGVITIIDRQNTPSGQPANVQYKKCSACEATAYTIPLYQFTSSGFSTTNNKDYTYSGSTTYSTYVTKLTVSGNYVATATLNNGAVFTFSSQTTGVDTNALSAFSTWSCPTTTCDQPADVILAIDMSGSIDDTMWGNILSFGNQFANSFKFGYNLGRMGLVWFGNDAYTKTFQPDGRTPGLLSDKTSFINAVNQTRPKVSESSCIGCGIKASLNMFSQNKRAGVPQILLILSDGQNNVPNVQRGCWRWENGNNCYGSGGRSDGSGINWLDQITPMQNLYPPNGQLTVFGIGVGNSDMREDFMTQMSSPNSYLKVGNYKDLANSVQKITTFTCPATTTSNCNCKGGFCGCKGACICPTCSNTTCTYSTCTNPAFGCNAAQDLTPLCPGDLCNTAYCNPSTGCATQAVTCGKKQCQKGTCTDGKLGCQYMDDLAGSCPAKAGFSQGCTSCNPTVPDSNKCSYNATCACATFTPNLVGVCQQDTCDPLTGAHVTKPKNCDDGNPCTVDTCDATNGTCIHTPYVCNDNNFCTHDSCNSTQTAGNQCVYEPFTDCPDDKDACTIDKCNNDLGGCTYPAVTCSTVNNTVCDNTTCNSVDGCVTAPIDCYQVGNFSQLVGNCHTLQCNLTVGCFLAVVEGGTTDACGYCSGDAGSVNCKLTPAVIAGITAGAIAGIAVGGAAGAAILGFAGKKGFDYFTSGAAAAGGVQNNPMYVPGSGGGANPMFEGASA
ncbi:hypothetical protein PROFUN_06232 [Planoprotostelium fungivorum]|uniref:VWFA domain-containing protein n=1 Tax=Planoprotostelium fungivorum TaxID=1890364 RepID=A0A2P6NE45_9EUKA|nr:hypothetical protein PROFUN_06232 [Planoprotostelium fungivorum]